MQIKIEHNIDVVMAKLSGQQRQVSFAAAVALTRTAAQIKAALPAELDRVFDRPTPFTKRGIYLKAARRDSLTAEVGFMTRQASYLRIQATGGTRQPTARGIRLPGNVELNAFGNIPRGTIARLKAAAKSGKLGTVVARRLNVDSNRRKGAAPIQLFYGQPTGKGWENAPVGIWRRVPPSTPGGKGQLIPVVLFDKTPARYRKRFNFEALGADVMRRRFQANFNTAFASAMRTAR
jgi:hypothetical protein